VKFFRNKLAPNTSYAVDAIFGAPAGREFNPYDALKAYPMYAEDLMKGIEDEGAVALATILVPNIVGIGLSTYAAKGTIEDDVDELVKRNQTADDQNPETIKNYNEGGVPVTDKEFDKYVDLANSKIEEKIRNFYNKGKVVIDDDGNAVRKPYLELTPEQVTNELLSIKSDATKEAKEELFGEESMEEKMQKNIERIQIKAADAAEQ
jgi:hypothetical protein